MQKLIIGILFLTGSIGLKLQAQLIPENEIIGTWKVVNVHMLIDSIPEEQKATLSMLESAFLESQFDFKIDKNFSFDFEFEEMQLKNRHWKYNDSTKSFIIQDWENKDKEGWKLMEIYASKDGDKVLFLLSESFFVLEMQKIK